MSEGRNPAFAKGCYRDDKRRDHVGGGGSFQWWPHDCSDELDGVAGLDQPGGRVRPANSVGAPETRSYPASAGLLVGKNLLTQAALFLTSGTGSNVIEIGSGTGV